jgi:glycosyltransferase involved in cell wall biosynthesis
VKKKIRIARIVTIPIVFTQILDLLDYLDSSPQFELHIICGEGEYLKEIKQRYPNTTFHIVNIPRDVELINDLKALISLIRIFIKYRFDIVHSYTPKAGFITALAGFLTSTPSRLHSFTGQVWVHLTGPKRMLLKGIDRVIAVLNTHNYADSFGQKQFLIAEGIETELNLSVIHKGSLGGINVERFDPKRLSGQIEELRNKFFPDINDKILLYLGRQNKDKGLRELYIAFNQLKNKYPVKLLLVGPVETMKDPSFKNLIETLRADNDVTFVNFTSEPELYIGMADIFCFPSYREGFGTVALEASAMEKPVVATNIYGLSDAVADGESGLLVEVYNAEDLREKLEKLLTDPTFAKKLGQQGRERVVRDFSNKLITEKITEEYFKIFTKNHG